MNTFGIAVLFGLLPITLGSSPNFTELLNLKPSQSSALQKFKKAASSIVQEDYMKEDIYLVKFLQLNNFNVRKSVDMLNEALKWRQQVKVDQWENPDFFEQFERKGDYPEFTDGFDRVGRPIVEAFFGDWNVRAVAVSGKIKHLLHYALRAVERATTKIREIQAEGRNITQLDMVINMDGFNVINQACPTCIPFYLGYISYFEKVWPNSAYKLLLVNTPDSFEAIFNLMRPIMSPQIRAAFKVFGVNKNEWKPYLDELIDPSEISDWYDPRVTPATIGKVTANTSLPRIPMSLVFTLLFLTSYVCTFSSF